MIAQKNRNEESRQVHLILIDGRHGKKMIPEYERSPTQPTGTGKPTILVARLFPKFIASSNKTKFEIHPPTHPPSPNYSVHQSDAAVSWL